MVLSLGYVGLPFLYTLPSKGSFVDTNYTCHWQFIHSNTVASYTIKGPFFGTHNRSLTISYMVNLSEHPKATF